LRERALANRWVEPADFEAIDAEVARVLADAVQFAVDSPEPETSTALDHVYSN